MKISIIIPTYNEAKNIVDVLQQYKNVRGVECEVIISDNGSTDSTQTLAKPFVDKVVMLSTDMRSTIGECRNRGGRAASGDIFWFLDADVRVPRITETIAHIQDSFLHNQKLVGATLPLGIYPAEVKFWDMFWFGVTNLLIYLQNQILRTGGCPGDCQIVRRSEFERLKGYNSIMSTSEDHDFFHRLVKQGQIKMFWHYPVYMSARRIRRDGWPKVLFLWMKHWINQFVFHKEDHKEWQARR